MSPNPVSARVGLLALSLFALPWAAQAAWRIDPQSSELYFVTTKAPKAGVAAIQEIQHFGKFEGGLSDAGAVSFSVDLSSVDTKIPLRDERIRDQLFKVGEHALASFGAKLDPTLVSKLKPGEWKDLELAGTLQLSGASQPVTAKLRVVRLAGTKLLVSTREPLLLNLQSFGLQSGVETLKTLANLELLSATAPVDFSVVLTQGS